MNKPKKTNARVIALPFQNNLFFRSVYDWEGCTTIADYTGLWPQYRVYNEEGYYIGCTNASNELSWQAAVRGIVKTYLTKFKGYINYKKRSEQEED